MNELERLQLRLELAIMRAAPPCEIEAIEQAKRQVLARQHRVQPLHHSLLLLHFPAQRRVWSKAEVIEKYRNSL